MVRITPIYKPFLKAIYKGNKPGIRGLMITMVMNHLLNGMILQVKAPFQQEMNHLNSPTFFFRGHSLVFMGGKFLSAVPV